MKKLVITSIVLIFTLSSVLAQDGDMRQRLETMKVAFITEKIGLSTEQAQDFWPAYNAFQNKQKAIRQQYHTGKNINQMSDTELEEYLLNNLQQQQELLQLKRDFFEEAKKSISIRQIALLQEAEKEFNKEVLKRMMERRQEARRRRSGNN